MGVGSFTERRMSFSCGFFIVSLRRNAKILQADVRKNAEDHFLVATCVKSSAKVAHQTTMLQFFASSLAETWPQIKEVQGLLHQWLLHCYIVVTRHVQGLR